MSELKGTQCRNVVYCKNPKHLDYDLHLVKVTDYYQDGTKELKVKLVKDFNKTFWVAIERIDITNKKRKDSL